MSAERQPTERESAVIAQVQQLAAEREAALQVVAAVVEGHALTNREDLAVVLIPADVLDAARRLLGS